MKIFKAILNALSWIFIFVLAGYIIVDSFLPNYTIPIFGFKTVIVKSDSMTGKLEIGDLVILTRVDEENLEEYDIVTFLIDVDGDEVEDYVTHYFSSWQNDSRLAFKTRNEKTGLVDNWIIGSDELIGEYVFHVPFVGHIVNFIKSPIGIGTILGNIVIIGAVIYLVKSDKNKKKDVKNEEN